MLFFHDPNHRIRFQIVGACVPQQFIDRLPIELPLRRFNEFPGDRSEHSIQVHLLQSRPMRAMYAALDALELPSSPPSTSIGLSCTMSCCVEPCFSRCGGAACAATAVASASANARRVSHPGGYQAHL